MSYVADHYDDHYEAEWQRLQRHRTEFAVTLRALESYLPPPPATVLDIGGGPGRYAIELSRRGYQVTLLDISGGNLAYAAKKAAESDVNLAHIILGDATKLPRLPQPVYDAVLLMGPLYHLLSLAERRQAVREAARVLRLNGPIFAAFVTRFAVLRNIAINTPQEIVTEPERFAQLLDTGVHPSGPAKRYPDFYFIHTDEIRPFMETAGFTTVNLIGCEGIVAGHEEAINQVQGDLWRAWVALNYRLGQEPALYGAADHLLYIGRKNS
jgi:ubiquinone/menaquinone biosynthesis C-methylase UbiE